MAEPTENVLDPEPKIEAITVKVTASERRDLVFVAAAKGCDIGPMLRERSLADILTEARDLRERIGIGAAA